MKLFSIVLIVFLFSCFNANAQSNIWILGDNDSDFNSPPFNDSLIIFNSQGNKISSFTGFNIAQTIGGTRCLQVEKTNAYCWLITNVNGHLFKISNSGNILLELKNRSFNSVFLTSKNVFALRDNGTIYGDSIFILDNNGKVLKKTNTGGFDIAVDEINSYIWITGSSIKKLDFNLNKVFEIDPIPWCATSVDIGENGNAWVAQGLHPQVAGSKDCIYEISSTGNILRTINFTCRPYCIRYDSKNKNLLIAASSGTYIYKTSNSELVKIDNSDGFTLDIDPVENAFWIAGYYSLRKYSLNGDLLIFKNLPSGAQRYIGTAKSNSFSTQVSAKWNGPSVENAVIYVDRGDGFKLVGTTTSNNLSITVNDLKIGDKLRAIKKVYSQKAVKSGHEMFDDTMFEVWINSDNMNTDGSYAPLEIKLPQNSISLNMNHSVYKYNLLVSIEWDITEDYYAKLVNGFKSASKYLYNVSDGQVCLNKVAIVDNKQKWENADIQIIPVEHPNSDVGGIDNNGFYVSGIKILNPGRISLGKDWSGEAPDSYIYFRTIIHEFGHYGFGLYDEYLNGQGNEDAWNKYRSNHPLECPPNYGFMDYQYDITEASSNNDYLLSYPLIYLKTEVTEQLDERKMPCWNYMKEKLEKYYSKGAIKLPPYGYYPSGFIYDRLGPNDNTIIDSTTVLDLRISSKSGISESFDATIILMANEKPVVNSRVYIHNKTYNSYLGKSNEYGEVDWPGAKPNTQIESYVIVDKKPMKYSTVIINPQPKNVITLENQFQKGINSLAEEEIPGINITGEISYNSSISIDFDFFADDKLDKAPIMVISYGNSSESITLNDLKDMQQFGGSIAINTADTEFDGTGYIDISYSSNAIEYKANSSFKIFGVSSTELCQVFNRSFNVNIDKENFSNSNLGISFNTFGKPYHLLSQLLYPVSDIFSIGIDNIENFINDAGFNVSYDENQVSGIDISSLGIYKWDSRTKSWILESSNTLNPAEKKLSCNVSSTGIYGVFAEKLVNDNIAPSKIIDLASFSGQSQSMINLSWTSPGDDGATGKAMHYIIKYNDVPVTDLNWDTSFDISFEPIPSVYGTEEHLSVKMPLQNVLYYFAIKSVDEAGNFSELSNSTSAISASQNYSFSLLSPVFNSIVDDLSPIFSWEKFNEENLQSYTLMIADNDLFENAVIINDIDTNSFQIQFLLDCNKPYFWKVKAVTSSKGIVDCNQNYLRFLSGTITQAADENIIPELKNNYCYPNPFNPAYQDAAIHFCYPNIEKIRVNIYDLSGKQIKTIMVDDIKTNLEHVIYWDGTNNNNMKVRGGIYFYNITTVKGMNISGKIIVSK